MPPRTPKTIIKIAYRQKKVANLYLSGMNQEQIKEYLEKTEHIKVERTTISKDIKKVREGWIADAQIDIGEHTADTLAKLSRAELEAWDMYGKAKKVGKYGGNTAGYWHKEILETLDRKSKLLGLNKPEKIDVNAKLDHSGRIEVKKMSDEELQKEIENELRKLNSQ
jgi:hypothetical protein